MSDDLTEIAFRLQMQALARKGGAATKRLHDPDYYRRIGAAGGSATAAARKARIARSIDAGSPAVVALDAEARLPVAASTNEHVTLAAQEAIGPATMVATLDAIVAAAERRGVATVAADGRSG